MSNSSVSSSKPRRQFPVVAEPVVVVKVKEEDMTICLYCSKAFEKKDCHKRTGHGIMEVYVCSEHKKHFWCQKCGEHMGAVESEDENDCRFCDGCENKEEKKEPRMIVRATYTVSNEFRIPRGIDLEDKEQVESWGIKWDIMEIYLQNGKTIKIDPTYSIQDGHDFKRPDETEIDEDDNQEDGDDDVVNGEEEELCSNDCGNLMDTEDFTCVNCNKNSWCRTCEPECPDMKYVKERGWLCGKCFEK